MLVILFVECLLAGNGRVVVGLMLHIEHDFVVLTCLGLDLSNVIPCLLLGFASSKELLIMKSVQAVPLFCGVIH